MTAYQFINPNKKGMLPRYATLILFIFFFSSLSNKNFAQVSFTQTSDADFNLGFPDNVIVSGNNVYLATKATGVNNWLSTNDLPQTLSGHQVTRCKNYVYLSGGYNGTNYSDAVYRATMQSGGNSTWTLLDVLPDSLRDHAMVSSAEHIYVIGGRKDGSPFDKIYYAKINSDGSLGSWTESVINLPQPLWGHTAVYSNGYIYVVGGTSSELENTALNTVYYAKITGIDGEISTFLTTSTLPQERNAHSMVNYDNTLVVLGGYDNSGVKHNTVYYASVNLDGTCTSWLSATPLTVDISDHSSTCYNGLITVIGGEETGGLSDKVYYANIDDLPLFTWNTAADMLYEARKKGTAYTYNGQIVFAGGVNISASPIHNTRYATVNLGSDKVHKGSFISYPFYQLGEERDIESLTYNITYNPVYNNYELLYRLAGNDQLWGNWVEMGQDNPALVGQHKQYIQYMIKYDGTNDDNIVLNDMTINITGYTQLSGNLNGIDTLKLENSPYWVTGAISFTAGTHVIEAGVTILFSPNTGLEIGQANMLFEGTSIDPILLTSYSSEPGLWNGVYFNTNSDNGVASVLNYVTLEKAGAGSWNANLYCLSTNEPQINNSTFAMAVGHGIWLNDADISMDMVEISGNTENGIYVQNSSPSLSNINILNNGIAGIFLIDLTSNPNYFNCDITGNYYGIYYPTPNYSFPPVSGISNYNNIISGIAMAGGDITIDQTWSYNPFGYAIMGDVNIIKKNSTVRLTIAPGNTIYCDSLVQIQVGTYIYYLNEYGGDLYAIGKPDSMITFTSVNGQPGGWDGIFFHYNSDSFGSTSELNNCIIENGRSYNIKCDRTIQPRIDSCTINNSTGMDIYAQDPNSVPHITNSNSTIFVDGGTQSIDKIWYNYGGDYIILSDIIVAKKDSKARLTIQPGITVKADTSAMIQIAQYVYYLNDYGGEIYAEGTADSLIIFTSRNGFIDGWDGFYFHYNSDAFTSTSSLKYCVIENGKNYNVRSDGSAEPRIDNCTINNTNGYDIYATFPNDVQHVTNTISTIYVGGGTQSIDKTWYNFGGGEYIVLNNIIIAKQNDKARLTIQPGITVKIDSAMIQVGQYLHYLNEFGGDLYAEGTADSIITFTSLNGVVGGWNGVFFHYNSDSFGSTSSLKYCTIEKGNSYNIKSDGSAQPRIDSCTINNTNGYDIYAAFPNDVQHVTNTISTIYVGGGTQSIDKTWYNFGGGEYIVIGDVLVAKQNTYSTLTIQPGNIIKFDSAVNIQIGNYLHYLNHFGGEIIAEGTPDSLIIFQPLDNLINFWDGIYFHYNADNYGGNSSFKYCIIKEGRYYNIYCDQTNLVNFEHVTLTNSKLAGIRLNSSSPYLKLCQAINNDSIGIILTGSSNPVIGDTLGWGCDIFGNGDFGIYNSTGNFIHAKNNFWNTTDSLTIAGQIYDHYDNGSYGIVEFMPVASNSFFDNLPPDEFDLLSLADNFVTTNQTPSFTWEVPVEPDGDAVVYRFYYTDDITWSSNITISEELTDANYTIPETLTGGKWYWWKVKASDGYLSKSSNQMWTFAVSLPPIVPTPIVPPNGTIMRDNDFLVWITTTDPDVGDYVSHYRVQIDDDPGFSSPEIDTNGIQVNGKASSVSMQISELPGYMSLENINYYWRISATDGFGIESDFSDGSNYFLYILDVSMKVFLEGPFMSSSMETTLNNTGMLPLAQPYNVSPWNYMEFEAVETIPNIDVVDWVLLEFRSTTGDATSATDDKIILRKAAFVQNDGSIIDLDGMSTFEFPVSFDDNTYLVVYHRNHLSIISDLPLLPVSGAYYYDFTTGSDKVLGGITGYSEISPGIWGMSSGDANTDGLIDLLDKDIEWSDDVGNTSYIYTDFNLDGQVDNPDKNDNWLDNSGKVSQLPH